MQQIPRLFGRFIPQLLHMLALPLYFFTFVLLYRPMGLYSLLGSEWFGVHVTILSCIIFASVIIARILYYYLPLKLNYTLYVFWCLLEIIFTSFFAALYLWLVLDKPMPYFDILAVSFKYIFLTTLTPYAILALSIRVHDYNTKESDPISNTRRMRFYDSNHNLKLVVMSDTVLYIAAEENYIHVFYLDNDKVKSYVLRSSMKAVDELCLSNGLVRCHRSYYINPSHVKVLRKDKEGVVYAVLDADDVRDIPVSKKFYNNLADLL